MRAQSLRLAVAIIVGALLVGCTDQSQSPSTQTPPPSTQTLPGSSSILPRSTPRLPRSTPRLPRSTPAPPAAVTAPIGTLTLGASRALTRGTFEPGAAAVYATRRGSPVVGFALRVPADAYVQPTPFAVAVRSIDASSYGPLITPASPLITVENGGAYAAVPMAVTVPVSVPAGSFALGFFYEHGNLEAMPLVSEDASSVTVLTRHFSSFFISTIAESALPTDIGTGFRAGEDDFPTPNYGTYVSNRGACAGQSLAELWYFSEMRAGGDPLLWRAGDDNGTGPATPGFWQDDASAYRLASSIQKDLNWNTLEARISLGFEKHGPDRLTYDAFRYAMLVTGAPQFVGLSVGTRSGGHVVVAYASTASGLWVADPNFPGQLRQIGWDEATGAFKPYASGADAATAQTDATAYDRIGFYAKTALVEWGMIGSRWADALSGHVGGDRFPGYDLFAEMPVSGGGGGTVPTSLSEGVTVAASSVTVGLINVDPDIPLRATVYRGTASMGTFVAGKESSVPLVAAANELGFFVEGQIDGEWSAVDFVRYVVNAANAPSATPTPSATPAARPTGPAATPTPSATPAPTQRPPSITDDPNVRGSWHIMRHTNGTSVTSGSPGFSAAFALAEPGSLFDVRVHGQDPGGVAYSIGVEMPSIAGAGTGDFGGVEVAIVRLAPDGGSVGVDVSLNALAHEASLEQLASQGRWVTLRGADLYGESDDLSLVFGRGAPGETRTLAMSVRVEGKGGTITLPITEDYTWFDDEIGG